MSFRCAMGMVVAAAAAFAAPASASIQDIWGNTAKSTEQLGSFTGTLELAQQAGDAALLTVTLTNTTSLLTGGYITGFVLNVPSGDPLRAATLVSASHADFLELTGASGVPFGTIFDTGAALGADWLGGGKPSNGIAIGETGVFTFEIRADSAASMTARDFLYSGPYDFNFVVRFRGFEDGGSDKVPANPTPGAAALLALAGVAAARRRR